MQHDHPLTLQHVLRRMRTMNGHEEVVTLTEGEPERDHVRASSASASTGSAHALTALGVKPGDRVATFSWNTQRHLEVYLAVPCMGAVLHTLNIRLFPEQLQYIVDHAEDRCCSSTRRCARCWEAVGRRASTASIELGDEYEQLLAEQPADGFDYPELDDRSAAGLCYTSGTTGNPKGVLYSHRSNVLHALGKCLADGVGHPPRRPRAAGRPDVPRQRVGLPVRMRDGGRHDGHARRASSRPSRSREAIETERVTIAGAVPTVWLDLLRYADEHDSRTSARCGRRVRRRRGAGVADARVRGAPRRADRPGVGDDRDEPAGVGRPRAEDWDAARARQGRPLPLVETRIVDDDGEEVAWDGESTGELEVRGP